MAVLKTSRFTPLSFMWCYWRTCLAQNQPFRERTGISIIHKPCRNPSTYGRNSLDSQTIPSPTIVLGYFLYLLFVLLPSLLKFLPSSKQPIPQLPSTSVLPGMQSFINTVLLQKEEIQLFLNQKMSKNSLYSFRR